MTGPVRHASARGWRRLEEDSPKRKAWDLAGGLLMIMAIILVCQYVWQIAAAGLDATYVQETIAADTGVEAADTSTGEIAEPQEGDPPVLDAGVCGQIDVFVVVTCLWTVVAFVLDGGGGGIGMGKGAGAVGFPDRFPSADSTIRSVSREGRNDDTGAYPTAYQAA